MVANNRGMQKGPLIATVDRLADFAGMHLHSFHLSELVHHVKARQETYKSAPTVRALNTGLGGRACSRDYTRMQP